VEEDPAFLDPGEQELLAEWIGLLRPELSAVPGPERARQAADWLTRSFGPGARLFALAFCREMHTYLTEPERRTAARKAVADAVADQRPDVIVAHSLGSLVAYHALWEHQDQDVDLFVTLGSPLAMPGAVGDGDARSRPPRVRRWVNLADIGDITAVPPAGVGRMFTGVQHDIPITAGIWEFQTPGAYLRSPDVTRMIFESDHFRAPPSVRWSRESSGGAGPPGERAGGSNRRDRFR
jgi:pimeloyl-ACP methyl ester carboxylesterase